ncbi:MAG TPA: NTP transferase domain-containing protein, partial [Candidatus Nitrosotenuis sp.]|nr:NTP transferase domain-containing protein [Candidatus Nitrosotenuis sp.]
MSKTLVVIPARLAALRLPNKPLLTIQGDPMIVHVWRRGVEADLGPVLVACCGNEIADVVRQAGGQAVVTDPNLPSGTDRVFAAVQAFDPDHRYDTIINLQGDLPFIAASSLQAIMEPFVDPDVDVTSIAAPIQNRDDILNPNVVKIALTLQSSERRGRALYFSR